MAGCASVGTPIDQAKVSQIQKGVTTRAQLVAALGAPASTSALADGQTVCLWIYSKASNSAQNFIPVVNIVQGRMSVESQSLQVFFGPDGTVTNFVTNQTSLQGRGGAIN